MNLRELTNLHLTRHAPVEIGQERFDYFSKRVVIETPDGHEYTLKSVVDRDNRLVLSVKEAG